jgi:hypothetical protein
MDVILLSAAALVAAFLFAPAVGEVFKRRLVRKKADRA